MKAYMSYGYNGPAEGASLVIANNAKEAKRLAWQYNIWLDDYTDLRVRWIRDADDVLPLADQDKLAAGEPHVIDSPIYCQHCGEWGWGLTEDDLCGNCNEPPGDDVVRRLKGRQ